MAAESVSGEFDVSLDASQISDRQLHMAQIPLCRSCTDTPTTNIFSFSSFKDRCEM